MNMVLIKRIMKFFLHNIKRIIKYVAISLICAFITQLCVNAQSISNNLRTINESYLTYFENVANSSDFKHFIITSDVVSSGSYYTNNIYYLCLTNSDIDVSDSLNLNATCDKLYSYSSYNNNYNYNISSNTQLLLNNTIYYSSSNKSNDSNIYLICLVIICCLIFTFLIFNRIFRNRYGGLKYERIS